VYGVGPSRVHVEWALQRLSEKEDGARMIVVNRDGVSDFGDLVCSHTASFRPGPIRVENNDEALDIFATFVAVFAIQDGDTELTTTDCYWRESQR
jgi:hypothetical protein